MASSRILTSKERDKRGCLECARLKKAKKDTGGVLYLCPFEGCPYKETDEYETYEEYLKDSCGDYFDEFLHGRVNIPVKKGVRSKKYERKSLFCSLS